MDITDELIRKFLNDACNRQEAEAVVQYLSDHPEALERFAGEEEWQQLITNTKIPQEVDAAIWQQVRSRLATRRSVLAAIRPWAVAASVAALLLTAAVLWINNNRSRNNDHRVTVHTAAAPDNIAYTRVENAGDTTKAIALEDGSLVYLEPNSTLRYEQPFPPNARLLYLQGEAFFKVAKDTTRPFTVQAGGFSTTALGTSFRITVFKQQARVRMQLLTGKVVIKQVDTGKAKKVSDVYLLPGRELNIDTRTLAVMESNIREYEGLARYLPVHRKAAETKTGDDATLNFNNQSLSQIFTTLQDKYHVQLEYDQAAFNKIFFTGQFRSDEKIDAILQIVAVLNNLTIEKTEAVYTIKK